MPERAPLLDRRRALVAAAVAAIVGIGLAFRGDSDPTGALSQAGCTLKTYPEQGAAHVQNLNAKIDYNSFPPTSGRHHVQPAVWDAYGDPLSLVQELHNLEHGGVIIQYGSDVSDSTATKLEAFYRESPNGLLLAPLPKLGGKIALSAWTKLATCSRFDEDALTAFRDAFRGKGPERFPVDGLTPGT